MAFIKLDKIINIKDLNSCLVDTDDILEQIGNDALAEEFVARGLTGDLSYLSIAQLADYLSDLPRYKFKDLLCDVAGVNHHTSKEELMKLIEKMI